MARSIEVKPPPDHTCLVLLFNRGGKIVATRSYPSQADALLNMVALIETFPTGHTAQVVDIVWALQFGTA